MTLKRKKIIWLIVAAVLMVLTYGAARPYIESDDSHQKRPTIFGIKFSLDF